MIPAATLTLMLDAATRQSIALLCDRVQLAFPGAAPQGRVLLITSSHSGEGVTTIAAHLAVALSRSGPTLLCDMNVSAPGLEPAFGIPPSPGLTDLLHGTQNLDTAVRQTAIPALYLLSCGTAHMTRAEVIESVHLRPLLQDMRRRYVFVVVDAPPLAECSATVRLSDAVDRCILVVEAEREPWQVAQASIRLLRDAQAPILGAVLNKRRHHLPSFLYRRL